MKTIINLLAKYSGLSFVSKALDGYKTKIGAVSLILSGLAELTQRITTLTDFASVLAFIKTLPTDSGWLAISAGIVAWGLAKKAEKASAAKAAN